MMKGSGLGALALGLLLAACAGRPSEVGVYPDHVAGIDRSLLVGSWACHDLDPPSTRELLVEFRPDNGMLRGVLPKGATTGIGARDKVLGEWHILSDWVQTTDLHPVSGSDEGLSGELASMVRGDPALSLEPRTLNVLDLDSHRLVFRNVNHDWSPVVTCRRLEAGKPA